MTGRPAGPTAAPMGASGKEAVFAVSPDGVTYRLKLRKIRTTQVDRPTAVEPKP